MAIAIGAVADTLDEVRRRGQLRCGISNMSPPFSAIDAHGERYGFDIDNCKAVSAAVLGRIDVLFVPLTPQTAFTSVIAGGVDLFAGGATWTFTRDTVVGLDFTEVYYYDGQGFLVHADLGIETIAGLDGAAICILQGTTNELNVADWFRDHDIKYTSITFADADRAIDAYRARRCDAFTTDRSVLAVWANAFPDRAAHRVLAEQISKEPFAPVVRQGDGRWRDVISAALGARLVAERLGITQANVVRLRAGSDDSEVRELLGVDADPGGALGLAPAWFHDVIRLVGNYGERWDYHLGDTGLSRGLNRLSDSGGLLSGMRTW